MQQGVFKRSHPIWIMESSSWDLPSLSRIRVVAVEVVIVVVSSGSSSSDGSGSFRSHSFSNLQQIKISIETKITSWGYNGSPTWLSNSVFFLGSITVLHGGSHVDMVTFVLYIQIAGFSKRPFLNVMTHITHKNPPFPSNTIHGWILWDTYFQIANPSGHCSNFCRLPPTKRPAYT